MQVLLDFHYSDSWADAGKQIIPAGWADIHDTDALADTLYRYTAYILATLDPPGPDARDGAGGQRDQSGNADAGR